MSDEQQLGMPQGRLDAIELRLVGADHRPWVIASRCRDAEGRKYIIAHSRRNKRIAFKEASKITPEEYEEQFDEEIGGVDATPQLALFFRSDLATDEMLDFVAHAPEDIEDLLREVNRLRKRNIKLRDDNEKYRKEMLSQRAQATTLQQQVTDMRRAWRTLVKEMGTKP